VAATNQTEAPASVAAATNAPESQSSAPPAKVLTVGFSAGAADLSEAAKHELDELAKSLGTDEQQRLQLIAYAGGSVDDANQARRLSLSRALNVRAYLIDRGIRNTRMDVRALGNRSEGNAADRVEIVFLGK